MSCARDEVTWSHRERGLLLAELSALCGFAITHPVLDGLGGATELLVFRGATRVELAVVVVLVAVIAPASLGAVAAAARRAAPGAWPALRVTLVFVLVALTFANAMATASGWRGFAAVTVCVAGAGAASTAFFASGLLRRVVRAASPAPVVFALVFLLTSPAATLLRPDGRALPATARTGPARSVVLVVLDELPLGTVMREGRIDESLFPNLSALARQSTLFRNATAVAARTRDSLPALLSGKLPDALRPPVAAAHPTNVFSVLARTHRIRASEATTALCPSTVCPANPYGLFRQRALLGDAATIWWSRVSLGPSEGDPLGAWYSPPPLDRDPGAPEFLMERVGDDQVSRFDAFLAAMDGGAAPTLDFIHLILPHSPWRYLPDGRTYNARDLGLTSYERPIPSAAQARVLQHRHILQAMYVDRLVGRLVERMHELGTFDRSAIVITADHGISFQAGLPLGIRTLVPDNAHDIAWVPLVVKAAGQVAGEVRDESAMGVDVAPTVTDLAGVAMPGAQDGRSLRVPTERPPRKVFFNRPGSPVQIGDGPALLARAGSGSQLFSTPAGAEVGYLLRGDPGVVGRRPASLPQARDAPRVTIQLDDASAYDAVDPASGHVPSLVSGTLVGDLPPISVAAIAVNGTIATFSGTWVEGQRTLRFAAMVPPTRLRAGRNVIEIYMVHVRGDAIALQHAPRSDSIPA